MTVLIFNYILSAVRVLFPNARKWEGAPAPS